MQKPLITDNLLVSIKARRGEHVRSKSEVMVADALFHAGVPYRYNFIYTMETSTHPLSTRFVNKLIETHFAR